MMRMTSGSIPILTTLVALAMCAGCKPWTVRPLNEHGSQSPGQRSSFDAPAYVESIWTAKVLPASETAVDVMTLVTAPPAADASSAAPLRKSLLVKGRARVTSIDLRSRVGLAFLDMGPAAAVRVALQVGPVLRGTALRDALPFIRFTDFVNQIDYAAVSSELNERALRSAIGQTAPASLDGKIVSFRGAATTVGRSAAADLIEIVPVALQIEGMTP
jgi:predicted lipoprotein